MNSNVESYPGAFVISMDFELHWGLATEFPLESIRDRLLETRKAIPRILGLFQEYEIHVTWAVVGLLFFGAKEDLLRALPAIRPQVNGRGLSPYDLVSDLGLDEENDPYHYAASLVNHILKADGQEIASHTFAHCVWDHSPAETAAFASDLRAALEAARNKGVRMATLVFPQNKYTDDLLTVLKEEGLMVFRGAERHWFTLPDQRHRLKRLLFRALRCLDAHLSISGSNTVTWSFVSNTVPCNIPGSRLLEFYSHRPWLEPLESLRLKRIQSSMTAAAKRREIFHLWWHPHQFAGTLEKRIEFLKRVLDHFSFLRKQYGMESLTMQEVAERCCSSTGIHRAAAATGT